LIDYVADIQLQGWLRLNQPFAGGAFKRNARDAADGKERTLAARAASDRHEPGWKVPAVEAGKEGRGGSHLAREATHVQGCGWR